MGLCLTGGLSGDPVGVGVGCRHSGDDAVGRRAGDAVARGGRAGDAVRGRRRGGERGLGGRTSRDESAEGRELLVHLTCIFEKGTPEQSCLT